MKSRTIYACSLNTGAATELPKAKGPDDSAPIQPNEGVQQVLRTFADALNHEVPPGASLDESLSVLLARIVQLKQAAKPAESSPMAMSLSRDGKRQPKPAEPPIGSVESLRQTAKARGMTPEQIKRAGLG